MLYVYREPGDFAGSGGRRWWRYGTFVRFAEVETVCGDARRAVAAVPVTAVSALVAAA